MVMKLILICLAVAVCCVKADDDQGSHAYNTEEFKSNVNANAAQPHLVMFYAPWCGHCKRLAPVFDELGKKYNVEQQEKDCSVAKVDCTEQTELCSEQGVTGYPTLKFFSKDNFEGERYKGSRDLDALDKYIQAQLNGPAEGEQAPSEGAAKPVASKGLYDLGTDSFENHVAQGHHFVKFFAPWCGHCKRLAPVWEELGEAYENDKDLTIVKVDCTQSTPVCSKFEVKGYPTLSWFHNGKEVEQYRGGRDLSSMKEYAERMKQQAAHTGSDEEKVPEQADKESEEEVAGARSLTTANFDTEIAQGYSFVKFYAPWCGHCKRLAPTWDDLANEHKSDKNIKVVKVDCTVQMEACQKFEVRGYPTLMFFKDGEKVDKYAGSRDLDALKMYITEKTQEAAPKEAVEVEQKEGGVRILNNGNFESEVAEGITFIKFYAPWCGHCKRLAPVWDDLAETFKAQNSVKIAKVDCTVDRDICVDKQVKGYPTLLLFKDGKQLKEYEGSRDLSGLSQFVKDNFPHDEL